MSSSPPPARRLRVSARVHARRRAVTIAAAVLAVVLLTGGIWAGFAVFGPQADFVAGSGSSTSPDGGSASDGDGDADDAPALASVTGMGLTTGSLVGGETQVISGTNLDTVTSVVIADQRITDIATSGEEISFEMPRSQRYEPETVTIELETSVAGAERVDAGQYTYEVTSPVDRQLTYAFRYWQDYNSDEWGDFNPVGGDCMNFVSQTLIERGWEMTDNWYNRNAGADYTSAWIFVPTFDNWLKAEAPNGVTPLSFEQRDELKVGDLVMFDWNDNDSADHIQIVSAIEVVDGETKIKMVGHNLDSDYRDLDETITVDHPNGVAWFYSVPNV